MTDEGIKFPKGTPIETIFDAIDRIQYDAQVMAHLEYMGYPNYILEFPPDVIAIRIAATEKECREAKISSRMCACLVFGLTWTYGILPLALKDNETGTKH